MKNRIMVSVLCICILLMTSGCGTGGKSEASSDESIESVTVTESDQEEQTESDDYYEEMTADTEESVVNDQEEQAASDDYYEEIAADAEESVASNQEDHTEPRDYYEELIADARECIEGKVEENPEDYYDFSYIIYWYGAYDASLGLGYLIEDIDGNGTNELIFGQNADPDSESNGFIYDLYTIFDGELVHAFSGGERYRLYLCENGMIANEGADGASLFKYAYYIFEGTELHLVEAVIYNGWDDRDNPWFYSTQTNSYYDTENLESVSEEQAETIMEKYIYEHLTFIPFVEE